MDPFEKQSFGDGGVFVEVGTTPVAGDFCAIQVLSAAVFSAFTENKAAGDAMTGITIPAGMVLWGNITAFTLTSGAVRAYRKA